MTNFICEVQLGLVPILAIGIPHCKTCTVVSTAAWIFSKEHTADTDYSEKTKLYQPIKSVHFSLFTFTNQGTSRVGTLVCLPTFVL